MDWAHIHLALNHFPVILAMMGAAAAVLATLSPRRGIWMYAAVSLTLAGLLVVPTFFTGEPSEKVLNRPWYIARGSIHRHEEAALISAIMVGVVSLLAAFAWRRMVRYPRETSLPGSLRMALLVGSLGASSHIFYTSLLGGRIIHDSTILRGPRPAGVPEPVSRSTPGVGQTTGEVPSGAAGQSPRQSAADTGRVPIAPAGASAPAPATP